MSKTACIIPWSSLFLQPDGRAMLCCEAPLPLEVGGRTGTIYQDKLADLWNADQLVAVRGAMARGERPAACNACWDREAAGEVSRRLIVNRVYRQLGGLQAIDGLAGQGIATGYRLADPPDWFTLELGNVCNLRCRSCSGSYSSRIAADAVASSWPSAGQPAMAAMAAMPAIPGALPQGAPRGEAPPRRSRLRLVPDSSAAWFEDIDRMADMIAGAGDDRPGILTLIGGEPFLIDPVWRLLRALVERGAASRLFGVLQTNGQLQRPELADLAPHFRGFVVAVSIDGHGALFEYLRHGASWQRLGDTLRWLRQLPGLTLLATPTLSNVNALGMVPLLRFIDEHELSLSYNVLHWPARLSPANLPPNVRRIAARRLRHYLDDECRAPNRDVVASLCGVLEESPDAFDPELFAEFMAFTNDLDASRGEALRAAAPELVALLRGAGIEWRPERRSVSASAPPVFPQREEVLRRVDRTISPHDALYAGYEAAEADAYYRVTYDQLATLDAQLRAFGRGASIGAGPSGRGGLSESGGLSGSGGPSGGAGLAGCRAIADFACHYGRLARVLKVVAPHVTVYACDIDPQAAGFCAAQFGATPVVTGWWPDEDALPRDLDLVLCVSLLTHTPLNHWRRVLRAWRDMLAPGGLVAFTFLAAPRLDEWLAGSMAHYGSYSAEQSVAVVAAVASGGFGFAALGAAYGGQQSYGVAFAMEAVVRREVAAAGLEVVAIPPEAVAVFGQELVLARRPSRSADSAERSASTGQAADASASAGASVNGDQRAGASTSSGQRASASPGAGQSAGAPVNAAGAGATASAAKDSGAEQPQAVRDVRLVALHDPRFYAPAAASEGDAAASAWARLAAAYPAVALPTDLGFGDPRVAEVRQAQAALAREHGIDAFCLLCPWGAAGPRWGAAWRAWVESGQPDFPFCLMLEVEEGATLDAAAAAAVLATVARALADRRYLRVGGRPFFAVRDVSRLAEVRIAASAWRATAAAADIGEIHLCAAEPVGAAVPADIGFDSFLEAPPALRNLEERVAGSLARPWPAHTLLRQVECWRDADRLDRKGDRQGGELYELWLRSAIDATRRQGGAGLVFVDAWNDWSAGRYLEPDDRDGRAALLATRRATRGPASGLVLLRQLRDALDSRTIGATGAVGAMGAVGSTGSAVGVGAGPGAADPAARVAAILAELEQVVALHEGARDRLLATVEAALGRSPSAAPESAGWVPVPSRQLPPSSGPGGSGGQFSLDRVGTVGGDEIHIRQEPIAVYGDEVSVAGWAHIADCPPDQVHLFVALESASGSDDRVFRVAERVERHDVAAAFPGHPLRCGFDATINLFRLPPGLYRIAIVQRTPAAAWRDLTPVSIARQ